MATLLTARIAFISPITALVALSIYAVLTILSGWLYTLIQTKMSQKPHRRE